MILKNADSISKRSWKNRGQVAEANQQSIRTCDIEKIKICK